MKPMQKPIHFEQSIAELETLVQALEKGDLPLEDALQRFEQGIRLVKRCQTTLKQAEQTIERLSTSSAMDATTNDTDAL